MKENNTVEKGIRSELVEFSCLDSRTSSQGDDIPEEKVDLVDDLFEKVEDLSVET